MATNNLVQYNKVAKEQMYVLGNIIAYAGRVNTRYMKEYADYRPGSQITVKQPPRYITRRGSAAQIQGISQETVVVTVQPEIGVDMAPTQEEMALILGNKISEWRDSIGIPAAYQIAASVDNLIGLAIMAACHNLIGTPGTMPTTAAQVLAVTTRLDNEANPGVKRSAILPPSMINSLVGGIGTTQWRQRDAADSKLKLFDRNLENPGLGFDGGLIMSQSAPARTVGTYGGSPVINGAGQQGASLVTSGWSAGATLNVGDVVHIAGVFAVNPQTRQSTGELRQFNVGGGKATDLSNGPVVACTADANGNMVIPISPPLNPPVGGLPTQFQTVSQFPAAGAVVTVDSGVSATTYSEGVGFYADAVGFITIPLFKPDDAAYYEETEYKGIGMRWWLGSDWLNGRQGLRVELLPAFPIFQPKGVARFTA